MHFFDTAASSFMVFPWASLAGVVWLLIALALLFDFLNGMHDAANSIATVVSTRVLSPQAAVIWAAFFNFVAFLIFPLTVSATIQKDIVDQSLVSDPLLSKQLIAATLTAACLWNLLTWYLGLPTSSSHALIGGLVGAALAMTGGDWNKLHFDGIGWICLFIVLAPLIGMVLAGLIGIAVMWTFHRFGPQRVDKIF